MKLQISKTALEMAVKNICRVINTKNALPILGDVLCILDVCAFPPNGKRRKPKGKKHELNEL